MLFTDKYTTLSLSTNPEEKDKIILSTDAYAKCEMIQELVRQLERNRQAGLI